MGHVLFRRLKVRNSFRGGKKYGAVRLEPIIRSHFEWLLAQFDLYKAFYVTEIIFFRNKVCQENTDILSLFCDIWQHDEDHREARPKVRLDNFRDGERERWEWGKIP